MEPERRGTERDSTEDWMLPEDRPSGVDGALRALEDGIAEVGRIALSALEESGRAAELAEQAAQRAEQAAEGRPAPQPAPAATPPPATRPPDDDLMRRFTEHADRVSRRLEALQQRMGTSADTGERWP